MVKYWVRVHLFEKQVIIIFEYAVFIAFGFLHFIKKNTYFSYLAE
jgi:hypothetical protein